MVNVNYIPMYVLLHVGTNTFSCESVMVVCLCHGKRIYDHGERRNSLAETCIHEKQRADCTQPHSNTAQHTLNLN